MQFKGEKTLKIFSDPTDDHELLMERATYVSQTRIYLRALALNTLIFRRLFLFLHWESVYVFSRERKLLLRHTLLGENEDKKCNLY